MGSLRLAGRLELLPEPDNDYNQKALLLAIDRVPVAYLPDYLTEYVHGAFTDGREVSVEVENVNGPNTASHLRLLCRMSVELSG